MIAIALGANLRSDIGAPLETLRHVVEQFPSFGIDVLAVSRWYETAPVPASDQPNYVNGVVSAKTELAPEALLNTLLFIEDQFGRERGEPNAARTLDLDVIDFEGRVETGPPILPHPRMESRAFVLFPVRDVASDWVHPASGIEINALIASLENPGDIRRIG